MRETWTLCDLESVLHLTGEDIHLEGSCSAEEDMAEWQSFKKTSRGARKEEDRKSEITIHPHEGEYEPGRPNSVPPEHYINFNLAEGEYLVQCPYDKSHRILSHRMGRHIFRCRANYRDQLKKEGREFTVAHCPWTTKHTVPQIELQYHSAQCEYRGKTQEEMEAYLRYCPKKPEGYDKLEELASDEWSDEITGPELNGTYDPKVKLESWPIIYNGTAGMNKTKKREFRDKQRLHFFHMVTKEGFFKSYKSGVHGIEPDTPQDSSLLRGSTSLESTLDKLPKEDPKVAMEDDQSPIATFVENPFQLERLSMKEQRAKAGSKFGNPPGPSKSTH